MRLDEKSVTCFWFGSSRESSLILEHKLQNDEELDDGTSKQLSVSTGLVRQTGLEIVVRSTGRLLPPKVMEDFDNGILDFFSPMALLMGSL